MNAGEGPDDLGAVQVDRDAHRRAAVGNSTLLLQALGASAPQDGLYVSGEESPQQVKLRAQRLGLAGSAMRFLAEIRIENILAAAERERPAVMVIDSIQTVFTEALQSAPGSVAQVRECAAQLVRYAKKHGSAVLLVGHVTKEGTLAGPRVLEHMVDAVLYFETLPHAASSEKSFWNRQ